MPNKSFLIFIATLFIQFGALAQLSHVDLNIGFHQPVLFPQTRTESSSILLFTQPADQAEIFEEVFDVDPGLMLNMELNLKGFGRFDFVLSAGASNLLIERETRYIRTASIDTAFAQVFNREVSIVKNWYANATPGIAFNVNDQWQLSLMMPFSLLLTSVDESEQYREASQKTSNTELVQSAEIFVLDPDDSGDKFNRFQPSLSFRARYQISDVFGGFLSYQYNLTAMYAEEAQVSGAINATFISGGLSYRIQYK